MSDESGDGEDETERVPLADLRADVDRRRGSSDDSSAEADAAGDRVGSDDATERTPIQEAEGAPLSDLRAEVGRRSTGSAESDADPFFQESVPPVDSEAIWADLLMDDAEEPGGFEPAVQDVDGEQQVVSKGLCHRCRYFGDPPTLHCTHEGTTIHRVVDMDHYRVSNCPMVDRDDAPDGGSE